jgi:hypothetical protein
VRQGKPLSYLLFVLADNLLQPIVNNEVGHKNIICILWEILFVDARHVKDGVWFVKI